MRQSLRINQYIFQSTLSVRRATESISCRMSDVIFQSTLSVRRATDLAFPIAHDARISIHALREESDSPVV